jgi:SAM-dependent methyltransferase
MWLALNVAVDRALLVLTTLVKVVLPEAQRQTPSSRVPHVTEPARWGFRRRVVDTLDKLHLAQTAIRAYELTLAARSQIGMRSPARAGDLPLPPAQLRVQVGPDHADSRFFLRTGQEHADLIRAILREGGASVEALNTMLDWGCGCGRILRHWADLPRTQIYGCDLNRRMVDWCQANLVFAEVALNDIAPPLPYPGSSFDFVYALSVFTHLPEDLQHSWIQECHRVLKPGGFLLLSTMGEYYASRLKRLKQSELESFANGEMIVLYESSAGSNLCSAYHPRDYVIRRLAPSLKPVVFHEETFDHQDGYLFCKAARLTVGVTN